MIFLFIDLIISYFTNSPTFFFLLNFVLIAKNNFPKLLIDIFYIISLGLINNYSLVFLLTFIFKNYLINLIFYLLCYKILKKSILLSR